LFGFDHGIALSITRIFNCTTYLRIYNQWGIMLNGNNLSLWTRDKLFRDIGIQPGGTREWHAPKPIAKSATDSNK